MSQTVDEILTKAVEIVTNQVVATPAAPVIQKAAGSMKVVENNGFKFYCSNEIEVWRAETMFTKEPGTIKWLDANVQKDDIFWDVGANIGMYSLYAAKLGARVYAFEPHVGTASSLLWNISANKLTDRITLLSVALDSKAGLVPFYYSSKSPGSSDNQLHKPISQNGKVFNPGATEMKMSVDGDSLKLPEEPTLVKIDTDGNEWSVAGGMMKKLAESVRSVQIEVQPMDRGLMNTLLTEHCKMRVDHWHYTDSCQKQVDAGEPEEKIIRNVVYRKVVQDGSVLVSSLTPTA